MSKSLVLTLLVSAFVVFVSTGIVMASSQAGESKNLIKCSTCSMALASTSEIEQHMKSHPGHEVTPSTEPLLKCSTCSMALASTSEIEHHMKSHPGHEVTPSTEPLLKCSTCSMGLTSNAALEQHMKSHHGN